MKNTQHSPPPPLLYHILLHAPHPHNSSNMNVFLHQYVTKIRICQHETRPPATHGIKLPGTKTGSTTNTWSELLVHYSRVDIKILTLLDCTSPQVHSSWLLSLRQIESQQRMLIDKWKIHIQYFSFYSFAGFTFSFHFSSWRLVDASILWVVFLIQNMSPSQHLVRQKHFCSHTMAHCTSHANWAAKTCAKYFASPHSQPTMRRGNRNQCVAGKLFPKTRTWIYYFYFSPPL